MNLLKYFTPDNKYLQICLYSMAILVLAVEPSFAQDFAGVDTFLRAIVDAVQLAFLWRLSPSSPLASCL